MIRRLIILLLIVGYVFADTIVYKSGSKNRTIENVEYIKAGNGKVYFKAHGGEVSRDCSKVVTFTDNVGNPIDYDCSAVIIEESLIELESKIESSITEKDVKTIISKNKKPIIGGIFITAGSLLILGTLGEECGDDCELNGTSQSAIEIWSLKNKAFTDGILDRQKIGFGLIALGGILVAVGI